MKSAVAAAVGPAAVSVAGLSKRYPGVTALDDVSLDFNTSEVTSVVGENGAGKSTLMTILAGLQRPDDGVVEVNGCPVATYSPNAMLHQHGVALVPQEIAICRDRTVAENILLGREPRLVLSRRAMVAEARHLLEQIATPLDPRRVVGSLSVADQQIVLIVRALARQCDVLILDEPTTSLTTQEVDRLMELIKRLRAGGKTLIYVSHRLPEVFAISDTIHVLRDGSHVKSFPAAEATTDTVVEAMVGRTLAQRPPEQRVTGGVLLGVDRLRTAGLHDVSFEVRAGEILGVAGLPDSGRSEVVAALFGAVRSSSGTVTLAGERLRLRSPREAMRSGIGYVPAERRSEGIFPDMSVAENATVLDVADGGRFGVVSRRKLGRIAADRLDTYDVRGSAQGSITGLSGGNQQKVILSRWLARQPRVLLLDDPTRGVDVGAKNEIYDRLSEAATSGAAVVMASSDLPELLRVCHRIAVMANGRLVDIVDAAAATERTIMTLATASEPVRHLKEAAS